VIGQAARALMAHGAATAMRETVPIGADDIFIGKDVLELLSSAMYIDPMTVYREYIQNTADAVDQARERGLLAIDEPGRVDISFDGTARSVRIRDNAIGIGSRSFVRRLTSFGASGKRGTRARGFRGVGRLAGLGYAQELIFRSRVDGEKRVSELTWDCRGLRAALRSTERDTGIGALVQNIVSASRFESDEYPERFFEVELRGIVRLRNDRLLNPAAVAEYLGQVAPVPFAPTFRFGAQIRRALQGFVMLGELDIHVEGVEGPVYRPHRDIILIDEKRSVSFERVEILELPSIDGDVGGIAWVLHHNYEGALPPSAPIKGLRLRSGNVQVGDNTLLEELFPESRFNGWSVGEVHVIDRRVVPNGRRDHFEQNSHFHNITNHMAPVARNIAQLCRSSSVKRRWVREFELHRDVICEKIAVIQQGSLGTKDRTAIALTVEQGLMQMEKIVDKDLFQDNELSDLQGTASNLRMRLAEAMEETGENPSPLARLSPRKRAMYEHMFALIYECSTNRVAAKSLVDRILLKVA
jgi:hypothetical protein